jgi:hypothetical protein
MGIEQADRERLNSLAYGKLYFPFGGTKPPGLHVTGTGALADLGIGPGRITLLGGPPKRGKTSLVNQLAIDALQNDENLVVYIANVEMSPDTLMRHQVARLSGISIDELSRDDLPAELEDRMFCAMEHLYSLGNAESGVCAVSGGYFKSAIQFCSPPFDTLNLACQMSYAEHYADRSPEQIIVVVDYVQAFAALNRDEFYEWKREHRDGSRAKPPIVRDLNRVMSELRRLASAGVCVIVVSAMARDAYDTADLGGFRGGSVLEYACDDAYVLLPGEQPGVVQLRHVASRNNQCRDRLLRFDGARHHFTSAEK